uniref:Chitin-binding type-2 domain-containing protein n=1 Tax=Steinernema glaseri TaxID=37863 RepID=A0A1I7XXS4_9BILA
MKWRDHQSPNEEQICFSKMDIGLDYDVNDHSCPLFNKTILIPSGDSQFLYCSQVLPFHRSRIDCPQPKSLMITWINTTHHFDLLPVVSSGLLSVSLSHLTDPNND